MCGSHINEKVLTQKIQQSGIFSPSVEKDAQDHVRRCDSCQGHATIPHQPPHEMISMLCLVPFYQSGVDIVGDFPRTPGGKSTDAAASQGVILEVGTPQALLLLADGMGGQVSSISLRLCSPQVLIQQCKIPGVVAGLETKTLELLLQCLHLYGLLVQGGVVLCQGPRGRSSLEKNQGGKLDYHVRRN
ncbi:hypothetical protein LIER_05322 [Lithospermum erythrorhizon]|uniref:Integrase zinc-binding domain-containing protein n=1 Tax=Lithospermum erythrorhizon TaxID=34254 RepID=A0AAV3P0F4_LITER